MAETDLKIKDAPLSTNISGNAKMAGSDGSGLPVAISLSQVYNFVNSGLKGEAYFAAKTDIPTKVSSLINDLGFITSTALAPYLKKTELPANVSAFTNDAGYLINSDLAPYALASSLPTKVSQLENDSDFATVSQIPTKTSDLTNDSGYLSEETDPTVPSWAKQPNKPAYTASEVGALSEIPQATSEALGGIKVGYTVNDKNYPVQIDEAGKAYVNVPWSGKATPVLASAPTEDTLTYMDSLGITVNFEIGQSCVYPSEGSADGWYISFLKNINEEGKAVWERFDAINIATENANNAATLANQAAEAATASKNAADQAEELRATAETARIEGETARQEAETARANAEQTREDNEAARKSNETARQEAESTRAAAEIEREANELTRKSNESTRQAQEAERQANTATAITNAETATSSANTAAQNAIKAKEDTEAATALATELNNHPMIIQDDVWYKWNAETDAYENTGISAKGEKGDTGTVGIMLDAEPTEETLTYKIGDVTYNFELGMSAIYPDAESDNGLGISFFLGTNSEGKAVWGQGGGGAGSLNETVMISLVSNQDEAATPDADLIGKSVHVIYGDQNKELVWQGEALKTTVPMNMTYQVVFPTDGRYKCPEQQEYIALAGETREVKGLYYTEAVTVNVTCDDGTSAEGQKVTMNGMVVYDVDSTGKVTTKIPFDVEYTVSVNTKSGYTSPSSVTETANSKTKTISMEYILIVYGVFIEATDGTLHQSTEWTGAKTANSIVVKQPTVAFRIALTQSSSTMQIHSSSLGTLENYMTAISDEAQAKLDMKSAENTANIMKLQSGTGYAAGYCNAFTFPDGKTKGLLPALGWLQTAYDNKAAVDACLAACGATAMDTSKFHWASTFWGVNSTSNRACWILSWSDGVVSYYGLNGSSRVRPFAEYV